MVLCPSPSTAAPARCPCCPKRPSGRPSKRPRTEFEGRKDGTTEWEMLHGSGKSGAAGLQRTLNKRPPQELSSKFRGGDRIRRGLGPRVLLSEQVARGQAAIQIRRMEVDPQEKSQELRPREFLRPQVVPGALEPMWVFARHCGGSLQCGRGTHRLAHGSTLGSTCARPRSCSLRTFLKVTLLQMQYAENK